MVTPNGHHGGGLGMGIIEGHLAHLARLNRRPGTIYQRERTLRRLETFLAPTELLDADLEQLRAYTDRGLGDEARYGEVSRLQSFYRWALLEDLIEHDPTLRLERPSRARRLPRPMPRDDVDRAISSAPEPLRSWFLLAVRAGLRACEIAPLCSRDVQGVVLIIPVQKGGGMGAVPMSPGLLTALAPNLRTPGWWFPHGNDPTRHITAGQVSVRANRWLHANGITHTLHSLRHTYGTNVYRLSGHDLLLTADLMRHRRLDTTRGYAELEPDRAAAVAALLDQDLPLRMLHPREPDDQDDDDEADVA